VDRADQQLDHGVDVREQRAMSRLRSQEGFTIMEMVVAMTIGLVVLTATFTLLDSTVRLNSGVIGKTDAMQRGRQGMDTITQQLRSQVCLDYAHSAVLAGATASSVTFYADFSKDGQPPVKRTIVFDTVKNQIRSARYQAPAGVSPVLDTSYPNAPTATANVLENIRQSIDPKTKAPVPFLQYYAYATPGAGELVADQVLNPPLSPAQAARVARIEISYLALPTGSKDLSKGVNLTDQIMARHADPNLSVPDPNCI
jgi:prepilin-type N-terminal cleavage/methylation domain-containing protein